MQDKLSLVGEREVWFTIESGPVQIKETLSTKTMFQYVREAWHGLEIKRNLHFPKNSKDIVCLLIFKSYFKCMKTFLRFL